MPTRNQNSTTRLALYLPSLRGGGAERVMVLLANGFAQRGYAVDLVLASAEGPYLKDVDEAVRIIDLKAGRVIKSLLPLVRYLRRERPAALLSAMGHANVLAIAARAIARVRLRVVVSEHANFTASRAHSSSRRAALVGRLMHMLYRRADNIVAVSCGVADDLAPHVNMPRSSINVIYNPVVTDALYRHAQEPVDHPWFKSGQPPVLLGVGRLEPQKNFSTLINAFAKVRQDHDARLVILGEGSLRPTLTAEVSHLGLEESVHLLGFVANPFAFMRASNLFILSSSFEGLPTVLIEVMACGTPVVSTNCPSGPEEILENGRWGTLVPVDDIDALAEAMTATLEATEFPDVASRAATFNLDSAVEGYLAVMLPDQHKETTHE